MSQELFLNSSFKCVDLFSVLIPLLINAGTFLLSRELRHFNLQLALGVWFCCCMQKKE